MTWEELKEGAKKMGALTTNTYILIKTNTGVELEFHKDGNVFIMLKRSMPRLSKKVEYNQMLAIMKALQ